MDHVTLLFLIAYVLLALASPLLPLALMWRTACLSVLAFVTFRLLIAPLHWSGGDWGYGMLMGLMLLIALSVGFILVLRLVVAAYFDWLTADILGGEKTGWLDSILLVALGVVGGIVLCMSLADLLGGASGGRLFDLGVGMLAGIAAVSLFFSVRRYHVLTLPVCAAFLVLAAFSFVGARQDRRIVENAEALAQGRPWCLEVPLLRDRKPVLADLGFFSLPKGDGVFPHLLFVARDETGETRARWSVRQQRFMERDMFWDVRCEPQSDFGRSLR